jgi:hypothetical protein
MQVRLTPIAAAIALFSTGANAAVSFFAHSAQSIATAGTYSATVVVANCNNSGTGSLRQAVIDAGEGGSVDLSKLACSKITLGGTEIAVSQNNLSIYGPSQSGLSISANDNSRVFRHTGTGTLALSKLTVADGSYSNAGYASGGCIDSSGMVYLSHARVTGCSVTGVNNALGGGVYSAIGATVKYSILDGNKATANFVKGGGLFTKNQIFSLSSTFEANALNASQSSVSGAGIAAASLTGICYIGSTLVHQNSASSPGTFGGGGGGVYLESQSQCTIANSTVFNNSCPTCVGGGIRAYGGSMKIFNSTITGNLAQSGGGVGACLDAGTTLQIFSTIIAENSGSPQDLRASCNETVSGANNDIVDSTAPIAGDLTLDPELGSLQDNGGLTKTMLPMAGSPVVGTGSNSQNLRFDQRGRGHPRMTGISVDIGAVQFDTIFADGLEL